MTSVEQRRMLEDLRLRRKNMDRKEQEDFAMMIKRDNDDEQFDSLTRGRLELLHRKYVPQRTKQQLDEAWKKMTGGGPKEGV